MIQALCTEEGDALDMVVLNGIVIFEAKPLPVSNQPRFPLLHICCFVLTAFAMGIYEINKKRQEVVHLFSQAFFVVIFRWRTGHEVGNAVR